MNAMWKFVTALVVGTVLAAGGAFAAAGAGRDGGRECGGHAGRGDRFAKALGLSADQKAQIRSIFEKHRPELLPLRKEFAAEKRALRDMIHSEPADEAAIRAQVAKLAATGADLAVRRARISHEVRAVLTPEQTAKLKAWREKRDRKMDRFLNPSEDKGVEEHEGTR